MINFRVASIDGMGDRDDIALERDRMESQARENRDALRFRGAPYSNPSINAGEAKLREIANGILNAIEGGETQYSTAIWRGTFEDIEAHLENTGCSYGAWSHLEEWFSDFAIAAGIGNPEVEDLDTSGSDKLSLVFSWEA